MPKETFTYTNKDITVTWKPNICIHSKICWSQLREVFDPAKKPWINMEGSSTEKIIAQVQQCPSGAISFTYNNEQATAPTDAPAATVIEISNNGPILIKESCIIKHSNGTEEIKTGTVALCRCGASSNKPYCDGSHRKTGFEG